MHSQMKMNNFETYYKTKFREDLHRFFSTIPDESRFHLKQVHDGYTVQFNRLTRDCEHLDFLTQDNKVNFGIALFYTVLTDMVCYSQFRDQYEKFRGLTLYPKFIGNCLSSCHYHHDPMVIFRAMNFSSKRVINPRSSDWLNFREKFNEAIPTMKEETLDFFDKYLTEIDGNEFWKRCRLEFPVVEIERS